MYLFRRRISFTILLGCVVANAECRTLLSRVLSTNSNLFACGTDNKLSRTSASMPFSMNHASALAWPVVQAGAGPVHLLKVHLGVVVFHEKASDLSSYLPVTLLPIVLNTNCNLFSCGTDAKLSKAFGLSFSMTHASAKV